MSERTVPWLLAILTAGWFGWLASRGGRSRLLWSLGGALFALVTTTIIFGLGEASVNPFSDAERVSLHNEWTAIAVGVIVVFGWLFTLPLHRHDLKLWKRVNPAPGPSASPSAPGPVGGGPESKAPAAKPAGSRA